MSSKLVVAEQWTKKDCRRGKDQESLRHPLSFLIKVAILQEGTGLTQDEEL